MKEWLRRIIGASKTSKIPKDVQGQNLWIEAKHKEWQTQWHLFFDADQQLMDTGEFDRPEKLPAHMCEDFRLIFGFSQAASTTRECCFSLFPEGNIMQLRFEQFCNSKPVAVSEVYAREKLSEITMLIDEIGPNETVDYTNIRVVNWDSNEGLKELQNSDPITDLLNRSLLEPTPTNQLPRLAAKLFLTEPLYAAAGNYYDLHDWVTVAMTGGATDALHTELYQLWRGGWQVALGEDGLVLAQRNL